MRTIPLLTACLAFTGALAALPTAAAAAPAIGAPAPDFELHGVDGLRYRLSDYKGQRAVVIAWFPKAFTGG